MSATGQGDGAGPRTIIGPDSGGPAAEPAVVILPAQRAIPAGSAAAEPAGGALAASAAPSVAAGLAPTAESAASATTATSTGGTRLLIGGQGSGAAAQLPPHLQVSGAPGASAPSAGAIPAGSSEAVAVVPPAPVASTTSGAVVSRPPMTLAAVGYTTPAVPFPSGQAQPVVLAQGDGETTQPVPFPAPGTPQPVPAPASPPVAFPTAPTTPQPVTVPGAQPAAPAIPAPTQWPTAPTPTTGGLIPGGMVPAQGFPTQGPAAAPAPAGAAIAPAAAPVAQGGQVLQLTPESAAELAVRNSIDLQITAANIAQAQAQVRRALGLDDVRLTASATLLLQPEQKVSYGGQSVTLGRSFVETMSLNLTKPLYTEKTIEHTQELAQRSLYATKLTRDVTARALDLAAREAAFAVLRQEQLADVSQKQATAVAAHLDLSRKLADGGVVAKFEVIQAETELSSAQGDVIAARTAVESTKANLRRALTLPQDTPLSVGPAMAYEVPAADRQSLIAQALQGRPEIAAAEASVRVAESNVVVAGTENNLAVNLSAGITQTSDSDVGWQVAVSGSKTLMDGNSEASAVDAARAQLEATRLQLEQVKQNIALEVAQYHLALDEASESLKVARQGVVEAEEQLRISKVRYENGIALGVEVLDAETALAAARVQVVNSEYNLQLAIAQLRSAVGWWGGSNESGGQ